jgi:hypothetical protein
MRLRQGTVALAASAALVAASGCGGGKDGPNAKRYEGADKDVAAVIDEMQAASRDGDPGKICEDVFASKLTKSVEQQSGGSCEDRIRRQLVADDATFKVRRIRRRGDDKAVVNIVSNRGGASVLYLEKDGGDWRITDIAR